MKRPGWVACALIAVLAFPTLAHARGLSVEVWTDRGDQGVYDKGDLLKIGVRASEDAHLLVYEIDAEGYVNLLFPYQHANDLVEGGHSYRIPDENADVELVVDGPTGQGYVVAVVSDAPFLALPWYLRPYDSQAAALGYEGEPDQEEGVTEEGRIVGDPFVAMERIRRRIVQDPESTDDFATSYTSYYLHEPVKYPRYLCYDCHRPGYWSWWTDFDPYYTTCSAFTFRVNYSWYWGPGYWFGNVPYFVYSCRPGYGWHGRHWYSGWDGWGYWTSIWGGPLRRYKSPPPPGYIPPDNYKDGTPPGLIAARDFRRGGSMVLPIGRNERARGDDGAGTRVERGDRGTTRQPAGEVRRDDGARRPANDRGGIQRRPASERPRDEGGVSRPSRPAPRPEPAREAPRREPERNPRPEPAREPSREPDSAPAPAPAPPAPAPPAPKPRDEARPVPPRGGSRGGDRGGKQIGVLDPGSPRNVSRGRLTFTGERPSSRGAGTWRTPARSAPVRSYTPSRSDSRSAPRITPRQTSRQTEARVQARPTREASRAPAVQKSQPKSQPKSERRSADRGSSGRSERSRR